MKTIFIFIILATFCYCDPMPENVQKAFIDNEVVPDVLNKPPKEFLRVTYPNGAAVGLGNILTPTQAKDKPQVTWQAEKGSYYTILKTDPDGISRQNPSLREIRHWIVINIPGSAVEKGDEVVEYIGAGPPKDTGLHRYVFLVYKQPNGKIEYNEPRISNRQMMGRPMTSVMKFAQEYNLGDPLYGCLYQAEYDSYSDILVKTNGDEITSKFYADDLKEILAFHLMLHELN